MQFLEQTYWYCMEWKHSCDTLELFHWTWTVPYVDEVGNKIGVLISTRIHIGVVSVLFTLPEKFDEYIDKAVEAIVSDDHTVPGEPDFSATPGLHDASSLYDQDDGKKNPDGVFKSCIFHLKAGISEWYSH